MYKLWISRLTTRDYIPGMIASSVDVMSHALSSVRLQSL